MKTKADLLYTEVHPDYFERQRKDLFWYERLWAVLLREVEKRTRKGHLIEFGSGPGFLLKLAERRGWWAEGVEPSKVARSHAEEMGCHVASSTAFVPAGFFSAGISTETLEHLENPVRELRRWRNALLPWGLLAISVPNDGNPLQRLFWGKKKPWVHHTHLHYFNPRSIKRLVEDAGFEVVWQRTSFPVELLLVIPFLPRKWAWKLSRVWPAPPFLWRFGIGRHCLLVARKV